MKNNFLITVLIASVVISGIASCTKNQSITSNSAPVGKQSVSVYLNDDPIPNLQKVLVDIRFIEVKVDTGTLQHDDSYYNDDLDANNDLKDHDQYGKWDTLSITPRVYDLLKLRNGADTLVANSFAHIGKITKLRFTLGPNDTVWTDSTHSYPLSLCDNNPYIYARVKKDMIDSLPGGKVRLKIEFDVAKSIEFENGQYCLNPNLKCYSDNNSGKIEGNAEPEEAEAKIMVYNATDTSFAIPEDDGEFKISGIKPAMYSVLYKATAPYIDTTLNNIEVKAGQEISLPDITLHK